MRSRNAMNLPANTPIGVPVGATQVGLAAEFLGNGQPPDGA